MHEEIGAGPAGGTLGSVERAGETVSAVSDWRTREPGRSRPSAR